MVVLARLVLPILAFPALVMAQPETQCGDSDPAALQWLDKMSRSTQEISYQGVVTYQRGDDLQVMQLSRGVQGDVASDQITRLTGQGAQVVRDNHPLGLLHPGHMLLQLGDSSGGACGLATHYRLSMGEGERVAGRQTVRLVMAPRDLYRYGYQLELDSTTALLLKASTVDRGDRVLERFQYADLAYSGRWHEEPGVDVVHRAGQAGQATPGPKMQMAWGLRWLPPGFVATEEQSAGAARRTYTDGMAVFSVFLETLAARMPSGEGVVREGSTTSYTRGIQLDGQPLLVTVIGEVPVNTARMRADSVTQAR